MDHTVRQPGDVIRVPVIEHNVGQPDALARYAQHGEVVVVGRIPAQLLILPLLQQQQRSSMYIHVQASQS